MLQFAFIFCICTSLILSCVSTNTEKINNNIFTKIPAYIVASKSQLLNSTRCREELQNLQTAVDHRMLWSLKVLDASGVFKPVSFLFGNNYWMGSRSQCLDMTSTVFSLLSQQPIFNSTLFRDLQKELPFQLNYFVAHFAHNSTLQYRVNYSIEDVITLGLCLPASCTTQELSFILNVIFNDKDILNDNFYFSDFQLIQVKNLKNDNNWLFTSTFYIFCVYLGITLLMTAIGTVYEILIHKKRVKMNETQQHGETRTNSVLREESKLGKVLMCFSVYRNTKEIFSTKLDTDAIPVIHGLKFLSIIIIIFYHYFLYTWDSIDNKVWIWNIFDKYFSYLINYFSICVDVYFFSSGCLVTYLYLSNRTNKTLSKSIQCKENLIEFFIYIIKRITRLTPAYMTALILWQLSSTWFDKTSQFYMYERAHEMCPKY
ncbi:nose resistant to fluoxetine protein 6-like [Cardiocondyla obscurior]|uniref:nose resistant to fluoxetine protein 6-like n=1 Tax=Cardiocondyla obscurior TaxID=286306 RepID=UPI0039657031